MKALKFFMWLGVAGVASMLAFTAQGASEKNAVAERIKPVGEVCLQGEPCAAAAPAAAGGGAGRAGEQIYTTSCTSCHATGAAGAPKVGDTAAWGARLTERGGKDGLYKSAISGFKGMPAKGLCMDCSDAELKGAVDYMLSKSGK